MTPRGVLLVLGCVFTCALAPVACSSGSKPHGTDGGTGGSAGRDAAPDVPDGRSFGSGGAGGMCTAINVKGDTPVGMACCTKSDCASGFCADGVCCESACDTGKCMSCNLTGSPGSCRLVPDGVKARDKDCAATDPATCGLDGTCNGKGACRLYPAKTACESGVCTGESFTGVKECDGNGQCVAASDISCSPYGCADAATCRASCVRDTDCSNGVGCGADGKCGQLPTGRVCKADADCLSGHCANGACCSTACPGPCVSCNLPGNAGRCLPIAKGIGDPGCTRAAASTCLLSGVCDGSGSCADYDVGTICAPATCAGTTATPPGTCSGDGRCQPAANRECMPARCGSTDCIDPCKSDNDCFPPNKCDLTTGKCGKGAQGANCADSSQCQSNFCVDHVCCESACPGKCMTCSLTSALGQCKPVPAGGDDPKGVCQDMLAASCGTDSKCDGKGDCRTYADGTGCSPETCVGGAHTPQGTCKGGQCVMPSGGSCDVYNCNGNQCYTTCTQSTQSKQCSGTNTCDSKGSCGPKGFGSQCSQPSECKKAADGNQYCAQGVCCQTACNGSCQACNLNGQGLCTAVPDGARDPQAKCPTLAASTCGTTGKCTGGACENFGTTQQCRAPTCVPGTNNDFQAAYCGGKGLVCPQQATVSCGVYACDAATGLCKNKCTTSNDCATGKTCLSNGTCGLAPNGARCGSGPQCLSGICSEGYCCNNSCSTTGTCMSCAVTGHEGTCSPVAVGGTDPGGRCTPSAKSSCGFSGTCDGSGKCANWDTSTVCSGQMCTNNVLTSSATCDGSGKCPAATTKSCGNYTCNGNVCRTTCTPATSATDCAPGVACNSTGNTCGTVSPNGTKCLVDKECASGACVQGTGADKICCATACPADSASAPSCNTGMCIAAGAGAGTCQLKGAGMSCGAPGSCAGAVATSPRTCNATGICSQAVMSTCAAADLCHFASTCTGGVCSNVTNQPNGMPCNNDTVCDGAETCVGGVCTSGVGLTCAAPSPCQTASCDKVKGCVYTNVMDGTGCNDSKSCTLGDKCTNGVCAGTVSCDDGNPCTADACGPDGTCTHTPIGNGMGCSDGNACNGAETCQMGVCTAGMPVTCTAMDACHTVGVCNSATGVCSNPVAVGAPCDDGNKCTTGEICGANGICGGGTAPPCPTPGACHLAGTCNPMTGTCSNPVAPAGTACDDGNPCTLADTCSAQGNCTAGSPKVCPQPAQCHTAGVCDPMSGSCSNPPAGMGVACNDGNQCTTGDTCDGAGACTPGQPVVCPPPADVCHAAGTCNPGTGACSNPTGNEGGTCDSPMCAGMATCMAGACVCPPP